MDIVKCFRYRITPSAEQEQKFFQFAGCRRYVWNWALNRKKEHYAEHQTNLNYHSLASQLVQLKKAQTFLKECHSQILQQSLMDLDSAFKSFFKKKSNYPKILFESWDPENQTNDVNAGQLRKELFEFILSIGYTKILKISHDMFLAEL